jgi:hypothetical protein
LIIAQPFMAGSAIQRRVPEGRLRFSVVPPGLTVMDVAHR